MTTGAAIRRLFNRVLLLGAFTWVLLWSVPNILEPGSTPGGQVIGLLIRIVPVVVSIAGVYTSVRMILKSTRHLLRIVLS